jgi:D-methionine transport system permease protein
VRTATPWTTVLDMLVDATGETLYMVGVSTLVATVLGIPVGVWLQLTAPGGLRPRPLQHKALGVITDLGRAMPFVVLLIALTALTRLVFGSSIGTTAVIVPLSIGAVPFVGRLVQNILSEVHVAVVEAAVTTGASTLRIVRAVLLRESLPALINAIGVTVIAVLGYSAMAGIIGGGGLGDLAIREGYQRFNDRVLWATVAWLAVVTTVIQFGFTRAARAVDRRRHASV